MADAQLAEMSKTELQKELDESKFMFERIKQDLAGKLALEITKRMKAESSASVRASTLGSLTSVFVQLDSNDRS